MTANFPRFTARDDLQSIEFGDCKTCHESVVIGRLKLTQRDVYLEPKPVGGSEMNPLYDRHECPRDDE